MVKEVPRPIRETAKRGIVSRHSERLVFERVRELRRGGVFAILIHLVTLAIPIFTTVRDGLTQIRVDDDDRDSSAAPADADSGIR